MTTRDIIVIGGSAGAIEALGTLVSALPADLPAAVFVVVHVPAEATSVLPRILSRAGSLPAHHAEDGEPVERGRIYVARPNRHLLIDGERVRLSLGPKENRHRPAVDPLFRTAARAFGPRVIGVVLTGSLDDGTAGLLAIKARGGVAVVQDPDDALYASMPRSARDNVAVDHLLPVAAIGATLARLCRETVEDEVPVIENSESLPGGPELSGKELAAGEVPPGQLSLFTCPECHGVLWESVDGSLVRYRCHTGHAYSAASLLAEQDEKLEEALWAAYRALEENAVLARRVAERLGREGTATRAHFEEQARATTERAHLVRDVLLRGLTRAETERARPAPAASAD